MKFFKKTNGAFEQVSEWEFWREAICGFDKVEEIQSTSQVCLIFHKDGEELGRMCGDTSELSRVVR